MKSRFERFADKYLTKDDDADLWTPQGGIVMVYHPDGEDDGDQLYRRVVLSFDERFVAVLNPEMVDADEDALRDHFSTNAIGAGEYVQGMTKMLVDRYNHYDDPDILLNITVFSKPSKPKV
jgi:glycosyltransferase A (GT-A) superfamily protein (DUF2064 family)